MLKRLLLTLLFLAALLGGLFGLKYQRITEQMAQQQPPPPPVVSATTVQAEHWEQHLSAIGSLVAVRHVAIASEVAGKVTALPLIEGGSVAAGDLLLSLNADSDQATLAGLKAELRLAELNFQRTESLQRDRTLSKSDLDTARAQLDNARAQVSRQQALIAKKQIVAPFAGLLGMRQVELGAYLEPGEPIVTLQQLDPIYVEFTLPEHHLAQVAVGQPVRLSVSAWPDERFSGTISVIEPQIDRDSRTLRLRATLANPTQRLRSGMFAAVETLLPTPKAVLTLPRNAISYAPYGDSVYLITPTEAGTLQVNRQPVSSGEVRGERVAISGLAADAQVVSAGHVKLRNGQQVKLATHSTLEQP